MKQKRLSFIALNNEGSTEFVMVYDDGSFANFQTFGDEMKAWPGGPDITHTVEAFWTRRGWDLIIRVRP